ncbi:UNVERIFIED_CONTAM: hypothetical protein GTU68_049692 [Idotea baltica]|nr:hypothetical protein [Idotea baltica]
MNIAVVGTGYVGSVTGSCFAETGNQVICVDIDERKVEMLNNGVPPIYEPGLEDVLKRNIAAGRLSFTTNLEEAVKHAEIIFLALPTPPGEDGSADLKYVLKVADDIGYLIEEYKVIVNKSTVPVGTGEKVANAISANTNVTFDVVSNPEFLREGQAVADFLKPDRVVVGVSSERAAEKMQILYAPFVRQGNPIYTMDVRSAELTKYAANSYLAARITFMNEIANICERVGADVNNVRTGMGSDSRIGNQFLYAGVGYGGSCFPKDVTALHRTSKEYGYDFKILDSVLQVNAQQRINFTDKVKAYYNNDLKGKHFAVWGLAFKPNTDDIREAPATDIIRALLAAGATVTAFDPEAMENVKEIFGDEIKFADKGYDALENADALLIITEWHIFRTPDFSRIKSLLKAPVIFDGRNLYDLKNIENRGFYYESIGRKTVTIK